MAESLQQQGNSEAKMPSIERRLARFVANVRIVVKSIWKTFLGQVLAQWQGQAVQVVLDCTPCGEHATIVYVGLLIHSRVLPLSWRVMLQQEHWEQGRWELIGQMLDEISEHLAPTDCTLIADRGLSGAPLVQLCRERGWHYLLRIRAEHTARRWIRGSWRNWQACGALISAPGQQWFGRVWLWQEQSIETYLSAVWEPGYKEPWFLISDQSAGRGRIRQYSWRMRVEATFQDSKSRGWDLEASLIRDHERLNRLLLALFIAMWWVTHLAACCIHHGQRDRFDRHDRRDKSLFRLGSLWLKDILRRAWNRAALTWCLPFRQTPAGWKYALRF